MNTHDKYELPPLPEGVILEGIWACPEEELISYRDACIQAAIEADRKRRGEPYTSDYQQGHEAGWQDCRELYEPVLEDHRRLVRELDVLLNGEDGAAEQANLCDIVAQVRREGIKAAEPVGYFQNVNSLFPDAEPLYEQVAGEHVGDPDVFPLYAAPQPAKPVTPRTQFEDARVQKVYSIICGDNHPPYGEHWDGYVSRLIVDALFPAEPRQCTWANVHPDCAARKHVEPVKPRFTTDPTDYINTLRNERDALANAASAAGYSFLKHADGSVRMVPQIKGVAQSEDAQTAEPVNVPLDKAGAVGRAFSLVRRLKDGEPVEDELRQVIRQIAADPVKVPSDSAIMFEWSQTPNTGDMRVDLIAFARALLARYGSTTGEAKKQRKIE